jgi:hypothetical protein
MPDAGDQPDPPSSRRAEAVRWVATIAAATVVTVVLLLVDVPAWLVVLSGLSAGWVAVYGVLEEALDYHREQVEALHRARIDNPKLSAHERLDDPLHVIPVCLGAIASARARAGVQLAGADAEALADADRVLSGLQGELRASRDERQRKRRVSRDGDDRRIGLSPTTDTHDRELEEPMILYSDPLNQPEWVPEILEAPIAWIGAQLDEVRRLHDAEIEQAVLMLTMWARLVLVALAPILGGVSFGVVPGQDGFGLGDLPWLLAALLSVPTAAFAPAVSRRVMDTGPAGSRLRRRLLVLEVPVCVAAILCTPCWPVMVFAAGWTNWWQRPRFNWVKLAIWIVAVGGACVAGEAIAGDLAATTALECAIAMLVILVIGGSYGAMAPISLSILVRAVFTSVVVERLASHRAEDTVGKAVASLRDGRRRRAQHRRARRPRGAGRRLAPVPRCREAVARRRPRRAAAPACPAGPAGDHRPARRLRHARHRKRALQRRAGRRAAAGAAGAGRVLRRCLGERGVPAVAVPFAPARASSTCSGVSTVSSPRSGSSTRRGRVASRAPGTVRIACER